MRAFEVRERLLGDGAVGIAFGEQRRAPFAFGRGQIGRRLDGRRVPTIRSAPILRQRGDARLRAHAGVAIGRQIVGNLLRLRDAAGARKRDRHPRKDETLAPVARKFGPFRIGREHIELRLRGGNRRRPVLERGRAFVFRARDRVGNVDIPRRRRVRPRGIEPRAADVVRARESTCAVVGNKCSAAVDLLALAGAPNRDRLQEVAFHHRQFAGVELHGRDAEGTEAPAAAAHRFQRLRDQLVTRLSMPHQRLRIGGVEIAEREVGIDRRRAHSRYIGGGQVGEDRDWKSAPTPRRARPATRWRRDRAPPPSPRRCVCRTRGISNSGKAAFWRKSPPPRGWRDRPCARRRPRLRSPHLCRHGAIAATRFLPRGRACRRCASPARGGRAGTGRPRSPKRPSPAPRCECRGPNRADRSRRRGRIAPSDRWSRGGRRRARRVPRR